MKLFINRPKEDWVVDRFVDEWNRYNFKQSRYSFFGEKIIWIIAPWTWKKIPTNILKKNKVLCTIHHIDEDKFDEKELLEFQDRDKYIDHYHVISNSTYEQVKKITTKKITVIPFWTNQNLWYQIENKKSLYNKYNLSAESYYVSSFQRDTEGYDLTSPKLSKGPDQFFEIVKYLNKEEENLVVILTGKRRQYIIEKLKKEKINFKYYEMATFDEINELYNITDLYIVSSRYEGGPQSILECALTRTPLISTDVGIAKEILDDSSIFDMSNFKNAVPNVEVANRNVKQFLIPKGFQKFNSLLKEIYEN
tara:strand:+ start:6315 stop:7238 length:924 start_codon:yes stop_codon:yes gene_type:complete